MNYNFTKKMVAVASIVGALYLTSCGKYEEGPEFSLLSKQARITGTWTLISVEGDDYFDVDNDESLEMAIEKDNDIIFRMKETYTYEGETHTYTYSIKGEWDFSDDKEYLEIDIDDEYLEFEILRLTNKELIIETSSFGDNGKMEFEKKD